MASTVFCCLLIGMSLGIGCLAADLNNRPKYVVITEFKANFFGASEFCKNKLNRQLAVISSKTKQEELNAVLKNFELTKTGEQFKIDTNHENGLWIAGTDLARVKKYVWLSTGEPFIYTNWAQGEPNKYIPGGHCVNLFVREGWQWNDTPCNREKYFVCE